MIDTHCHLDYLAPGERAPALEGLSGAVCIGASLEHARAALALAGADARVWATAGLHPGEVGADTRSRRAEIGALLAHPRVVAVGETGLDDYHDPTQGGVQRDAFAWQLGLARTHGLPVVVHTRDREGTRSAHAGVQALLGAFPEVVPILHCFSGDPELLAWGVERGAYFGFAGNLTYRSARAVQAAALGVPLTRLLVETDAPFLAPAPHRGKPNRPAWVRHTLEHLAALRGLSVPEMERICDENARRVYWRMTAKVTP